jgi:outer membrane protein assembly factor BamB
MRKILALLLIVMFLTLPSLITSRQVSATFVANNNLAPNPTLLWNYTTSNGVWSSPTIDNGVLYVGCEDVVYTGTQVNYAGNLYALNAANGDKLWNYSIPVGGSSPAVASGVVYVGSFDGNVYAFNATNGVKLWSYPAGDLVSSSPAVADGIVYIGLSDGNLVALNGSTGEEVWKHHTIGGVGSPIVQDGVVFAVSSVFIPIFTFNSDVYALNATNGKNLWDYNINNSAAFPTLVDETLYVGVGSNVSALSSVNGSLLWSNSLVKQTGLGALLKPTAVLDNVLYIGSSDGGVYALNTNNGGKIWNQSLGNLSESSPGVVNGVTSPAVVNGVVYIASNDGNLYALNATNGDVLWNYTISDRDHAVQSSPVVANGVVYIGSGAHNVYAFGNQVAPNASSDTLLTVIGAVLIVIIIIITVIIFLKRLKPKSSNRDMPD